MNNLEGRKAEDVDSFILLLLLTNGVFRKVYGLELKAGMICCGWHGWVPRLTCISYAACTTN